MKNYCSGLASRLSIEEERASEPGDKSRVKTWIEKKRMEKKKYF